MNNNRNNLIKETARKLRKHSTKSEKIFWEVVRNIKIRGKNFQRQFPIRFEKVIRFTNGDIENNLDDVISRLKNSL